MAASTSRQSQGETASSLLLGIPTGILAIRIFLWLLSLLAVYGLHQLVISAMTSHALSVNSVKPSVNPYGNIQALQGQGILCLPTDLDQR